LFVFGVGRGFVLGVYFVSVLVSCVVVAVIIRVVVVATVTAITSTTFVSSITLVRFYFNLFCYFLDNLLIILKCTRNRL